MPSPPPSQTDHKATNDIETHGRSYSTTRRTDEHATYVCNSCTAVPGMPHGRSTDVTYRVLRYYDKHCRAEFRISNSVVLTSNNYVTTDARTTLQDNIGFVVGERTHAHTPEKKKNVVAKRTIVYQ